MSVLNGKQATNMRAVSDWAKDDKCEINITFLI